MFSSFSYSPAAGVGLDGIVVGSDKGERGGVSNTFVKFSRVISISVIVSLDYCLSIMDVFHEAPDQCGWFCALSYLSIATCCFHCGLRFFFCFSNVVWE